MRKLLRPNILGRIRNNRLFSKSHIKKGDVIESQGKKFRVLKSPNVPKTQTQRTVQTPVEKPSYLYSKPKETVYKEKAYNNMALARKMMVKENGFKAFFSLRYLALLFSQITLSYAYPLTIAAIILAILVATVFFGMVSLAHSLYFLKSIPCLFGNALLTIGNAIWFAFHAITEIIMAFFIHFLNALSTFFIAPLTSFVNSTIVNAINGIISALNAIGTDIDYIGYFSPPTINYAAFNPQPDVALSYFYPEPIEFDASGGIALGSIFTYASMIPGEDVYVTDSAGEVVYDTHAVINMAEVNYPRLNNDARSDGIITKYLDRPPTLVYTFSPPAYENPFDFIGNKAVEAIGRTLANALNAMQIGAAETVGIDSCSEEQLRADKYPYHQDADDKIEIYNGLEVKTTVKTGSGPLGIGAIIGMYDTKTKVESTDPMAWFYAPDDAISMLKQGGWEDEDALIWTTKLVYTNPNDDTEYFLYKLNRFSAVPVYPGEPMPNDESYRRIFKIGEYAPNGDTTRRYYPIYYDGARYISGDDGSLVIPNN